MKLRRHRLFTSGWAVMSALAHAQNTPSTFPPSAVNPVDSERVYGMAGCGLGSVLLPDGPWALTSFVNGLAWNQTFMISSGTSNCQPQISHFSMREQEHFFVNNYQDLARETARGDGELLRTLADTLHCPERIRNRLAAVTQHNHRDIFSQSDALAGFVRLKTQIHNDDILNTACREATQPARPVRYSRYASAVGEQPSRKNEDTQPQVPTDPLPLQYNPDAQSIPLQETTPGGSQPQPQIAPKTQPSPQLLPPVTQPVRTAARHPSYGMAGCGLGSMVFKNNVRSEQWLASIINDAIIPQSIVITTGTSNCVDTDTADMHSEQEIFIENNLNALQLESARGEGASLRALADLLGCEDVTSHAALASLAQNQHAYIFSDNHPHSIGLRYRNVFGASPSIKKHCKRLF